MKATVKSIVLEMIPVIFGILIALFISNWKEGTDDQKFLSHVMGSIRNEAQENENELKVKIEEHEALLDTIMIYLEDDAVAVGALIGKVNGFRGVSVKNASWNAVLNDKLELVNYEIISNLSDIEEGKKHYSILTVKIMDFLYKELESTRYRKKQLFSMMIGDLLYTEGELLKSHQQFLKASKDI